MRRRTSFTAFVIACCSALLTTVPASPVHAVNWAGKSNATGCEDLNQADNRQHTIRRYNLTTEYSNAVAWQVANVLEPTIVDPSLVSSSDDKTDVIIYDGAYKTYCGYSWWQSASDGGVIGLVICDSLASQGDCEQHMMFLSTTWATSDEGTTNQVRRLVSHEMGHTLGLAHRSSTTTAGVMEPSPPWETANYTSNHDITHLDALD